MTLRILGDVIQSALIGAFQVNNKRAGWGVRSNEPISVTNTTESLLALKRLEPLVSSDAWLGEKAAIIEDYLRTQIDTFLADGEQQPTRYLSCGVLGLHLISPKSVSPNMVQTLESISCGGGWPVRNGGARPSLVPTFQAMRTLQYIGATIEDSHYNWLPQLRKYDELYAFNEETGPGSYAASSLVLNLLAHGQYMDRAFAAELLETMKERWPENATRLVGDNWVEVDLDSHFKIYWFGLLLEAFHKADCDLIKLGLEEVSEVLNAATHPTYRVVATREWNENHPPLYLEYALAARTLQSACDVLAYYRFGREYNSAELEAERRRIGEQQRVIELRQNVIDEWERSILREKALLVHIQESIEVGLDTEAVAESIVQSLVKKGRRGALETLLLMGGVVTFCILVLVPLIIRYMKGDNLFEGFEELWNATIPGALFIIWGIVRRRRQRNAGKGE